MRSSMALLKLGWKVQSKRRIKAMTFDNTAETRIGEFPNKVRNAYGKEGF